MREADKRRRQETRDADKRSRHETQTRGTDVRQVTPQISNVENTISQIRRVNNRDTLAKVLGEMGYIKQI